MNTPTTAEKLLDRHFAILDDLTRQRARLRARLADGAITHDEFGPVDESRYVAGQIDGLDTAITAMQQTMARVVHDAIEEAEERRRK